jgi:Winged helix-turn-helix domain (DUF2582)
MNLNGQIGEVAGKVWHTLSSEGPQTLVKLKKKLDTTSDLINFGVGWLAREDKVLISRDKKTVRVQLK